MIDNEKKLHISFADGGWILVDPVTRAVTKSGNDWEAERHLVMNDDLETFIAITTEQVPAFLLGLKIEKQMEAQGIKLNGDEVINSCSKETMN